MRYSSQLLALVFGLLFFAPSYAGFEEEFLAALNWGDEQAYLDLIDRIDPNRFVDIGLGDTKGSILSKLISDIASLKGEAFFVSCNLLKRLVERPDQPDVNLPVTEGGVSAFQWFLLHINKNIEERETEALHDVFNAFVKARADMTPVLVTKVFENDDRLAAWLKQLKHAEKKGRPKAISTSGSGLRPPHVSPVSPRSPNISRRRTEVANFESGARGLLRQLQGLTIQVEAMRNAVVKIALRIDNIEKEEEAIEMALAHEEANKEAPIPKELSWDEIDEILGEPPLRFPEGDSML